MCAAASRPYVDAQSRDRWIFHRAGNPSLRPYLPGGLSVQYEPCSSIADLDGPALCGVFYERLFFGDGAHHVDPQGSSGSWASGSVWDFLDYSFARSVWGPNNYLRDLRHFRSWLDTNAFH